MNIELKGFQEIAASQLREDIEYARAEAARGRSQAIVLSSPTGIFNIFTQLPCGDFLKAF